MLVPTNRGQNHPLIFNVSVVTERMMNHTETLYWV